VQLEVLDPEGAGILAVFGDWCEKVLDGPTEVFQAMDTDGSNSLTGDEFAEGLRVLGFFEEPKVLANLATEHLVLANLFPLLDVNGYGHVMAEHLLFLERKKEKKEKLKREFDRIHTYGKLDAVEPLPRQADELLRKHGKRSMKSFGRARRRVLRRNLSAPAVRGGEGHHQAAPASLMRLRPASHTSKLNSEVQPTSHVQTRPKSPAKQQSAAQSPKAKAAAKPRAVSGQEQKARLRKKVFCQSLVPPCPALDQLLGQDVPLRTPAPLPQPRSRSASKIGFEPHRHWDFMTAAKERGIWEFYDSRPIIPDPL